MSKEKINPLYLPNEEEDDDIRVTLTMDDGSDVECEILTIFDVGDQDYIALLPLTIRTSPTKTERSSSTAILKAPRASLLWKILRMMKNTRPLPTASTSFWMTRNLKKWIDWDTLYHSSSPFFIRRCSLSKLLSR